MLIVKEFLLELFDDVLFFDLVMIDLYFNLRVFKFLDDYNEFDKVELVNYVERFLKDEMRGE